MSFADELDSVAKSSSQWDTEREKAKEKYIISTVNTIKSEIKRKVESGTFDSRRGSREVSYRHNLGNNVSISVYSQGKSDSIVVLKNEVKRGLLTEKFYVEFTHEGIEIVGKILNLLEENSIKCEIGYNSFSHATHSSRDIIPYDISKGLKHEQDQSISFFIDCKVLF